MIRLNCFIKVDESKKEVVLEAARKLTEASRKQNGCVAYDVFESATRAGILLICETWADDAALQEHSDSEEFQKYVGIMRANAEMKLEKFQF